MTDFHSVYNIIKSNDNFTLLVARFFIANFGSEVNCCTFCHVRIQLDNDAFVRWHKRNERMPAVCSTMFVCFGNELWRSKLIAIAPKIYVCMYIHICIYRDYSFICGRYVGIIYTGDTNTHLKRYDARVFALEQRMQRSPRCMNCALVHGLAGWCQHTVSLLGCCCAQATRCVELDLSACGLSYTTISSRNFSIIGSQPAEHHLNRISYSASNKSVNKMGYSKENVDLFAMGLSRCDLIVTRYSQY